MELQTLEHQAVTYVSVSTPPCPISTANLKSFIQSIGYLLANQLPQSTQCLLSDRRLGKRRLTCRSLPVSVIPAASPITKTQLKKEEMNVMKAERERMSL